MSIGLMDHQSPWSIGDTIGLCVVILVLIGIGVGLYLIPADTAEEKERVRQVIDFDNKCFAVRGRKYSNPDTSEYECYNGPILVFSKPFKVSQ